MFQHTHTHSVFLFHTHTHKHKHTHHIHSVFLFHTHTHTNTRINKNTHIRKRKHTMPLVFFNVAQQGPAGGYLRTKLSNELVKSKVQIADVQDWLKVWCYEIFLSS
jgi:hypothetical protein